MVSSYFLPFQQQLPCYNVLKNINVGYFRTKTYLVVLYMKISYTEKCLNVTTYYTMSTQTINIFSSEIYAHL